MRLLLAAIVAVVLAGGGFPADAAAPPLEPPAGPGVQAIVPMTLYGHFTKGWGNDSAISKPNPTLVVAKGDDVLLHLIAVDGFDHIFFIDYNGDFSPNGAEPTSAQFNSETWLNFTASVAGSFTYYCFIHESRMSSTWITAPPNLAPTATPVSPSVGARWTGGTQHTVSFNIADDRDPNSGLTAYANYSRSGGAIRGIIGGPVAGGANPNSMPWSVPPIDAVDVVVNITVVDTAGLAGYANAPSLIVDSTPPSLASRSPAPASVDVPTNADLVLGWSERMNTGATGNPASVALRDVSSGTWIAGAFSWNAAGDQLTFAPSSLLSPMTSYNALVNASAKDSSDPGNAIAATATWAFTTGVVTDVTPPVLTGFATTPSAPEVGLETRLAVHADDPSGVVAVSAEISGAPLPVAVNVSLRNEGSGTWAGTFVFRAPGSYTVRLWANDATGLWASVVAVIAAVDTRPPVISEVFVNPRIPEVGETVEVSARLQDNDAVTAVFSLDGGTPRSMTVFGQRAFASATSIIAGAHPFAITAQDPTGNVATARGVLDYVNLLPPPTPLALAAQRLENGSVLLTWSPSDVPDIAGYEVLRATQAGGPYAGPLNPPGSLATTFVDTTAAEPGSAYHYVVRAVDSGGLRSEFSPEAAAAALPPLAMVPLWLGVAVVAVAAGAVVALNEWRIRRR